MNRSPYILIVVVLLARTALCVPKSHVVSLGKSSAIKWCVGPNEGKCLDLKVRALYVDAG
jgi:hypothetical protein